MAALLKAAAPQLRDFERQHLANTVWALATLGHKHGAFVAALLMVATLELREFTPQALANTVWALATLGQTDTDGVFIAALLKVAAPQLCDFKPQELANTVWALATLGHKDRAFVATLPKAATSQLRYFNPQNLANTMWALATVGHKDGVFIAALLKAAAPHLRDFMPQALANTAWALATIGHYDRAFMAALLKAATPQLRNFKPQVLSNTAWALAVLGHADCAFMAALLQQTSGMVLDLISHAACRMQSPPARGPATRPTVRRPALRLLPRLLSLPGPLLLPPLFVLSIPVARGANWFLAGGGRRMDEEEATAAAAERIAAAAEDGTSLPVRLATDVVRFLYGGTGRREPADGGVLDVLAVVRQLPGCSGATYEQATDDGLFSIDIAVHLPDGSRLAVEVDGPQHFLSSPSGRLNGATLLRNRLLEARGWRVVSVPARTGWDPHAEQGQHAARDYLVSLGVGPL
ncbi:hypothetical protein FOA52_014478 [Chlamydomonas sp. UWO 241]|nr:hypothetical protein FOA52_014478 [Chlamydomonas sp. UWO 241]